MSCFCRHSFGPLTLALPSLDVSLSATLPGAQAVLSLSAWHGSRGLPGAPWQPDPAWLSLGLPQMRLSASTIGTISALAQLRAQVQAQFGLDLLAAADAAAFARIAATLEARLSVAAGFNAQAWIELAALNAAVGSVRAALGAGLLAPSASLSLALSMPGGVAMGEWGGFLSAMAQLSALMTAAAQLDVDLSGGFAGHLSGSLELLASLRLPSLPTGSLLLMCHLAAALSAVAQLGASLDVRPLSIGFSAALALVQARLGGLSADLQAGLQASLPGLPRLAAGLSTGVGTGASVRAAMSLNARALATLDLQLGGAATLRVGLPTCALAAQLQAVLGIAATTQSGCASLCNSEAVLAELGAAAA